MLDRVFRRRNRDDKERTALFLHIGMNKTGTSSLQRALVRSAKLLRKKGILYPNTGRGASSAHYLISHALGFSHGVPKALNHPSQLEKLRPRLIDEVRRSGCRTAFVSSEAFVIDGDIARVREFFEDFECRIVVYLRRHDHWWASGYAQGLRALHPLPWSDGFETYLDYQQSQPGKGNYRMLVDNWAREFGASSLIVRPYEPEQNLPHLLADLMIAIGRADLANSLDRFVETRNPSPDREALAIIDAIQRTNVEESLRNRIIDSIRSNVQPVNRESVIPPALRLRLVEENLEDYAYIARTYMGRADGRLFFEALPDPQASWEPAAEPKLEQIIMEVVRALDKS